MVEKKESQYSGVPHQQAELQPLQPSPAKQATGEVDDDCDNVPVELQLFRMENILIPACYLCVGVCQGTWWWWWVCLDRQIESERMLLFVF